MQCKISSAQVFSIQTHLVELLCWLCSNIPASSVIGPARWCGRVFASVTGVTGFSGGAGRRCRGSGPTLQQTSQFTASRFHSYLEETDHSKLITSHGCREEKNNQRTYLTLEYGSWSVTSNTYTMRTCVSVKHASTCSTLMKAIIWSLIKAYEG